MIIITPSMCIVTDAGRYYFFWICYIHAVAVMGVAQGQDCGSESCSKGHAVVQQLRARQRQIEADLVQEPSFQQAQQQM